MSHDEPVKDERLIACALGELSPDDETMVRASLGPAEIARLEAISAIVATLREARADEPPRALIDRAVAAWPRRSIADRLGAWMDDARQIVTRLAFDSNAQPAITGFRGGPGVRQLAYETESGRIDLQLSPGSDDASWTIRGAVAMYEAEPGRVALRGRNAQMACVETWTDETGHFRLSCPAGVYELIVELDHGDTAIVAKDLVVDG